MSEWPGSDSEVPGAGRMGQGKAARGTSCTVRPRERTQHGPAWTGRDTGREWRKEASFI